MSDLGEITPCYAVTFRRTSKHPPARLWRAITDPKELAAWMETPPARIDLRVGGEYRVPFKEDWSDSLDGVIVRIEGERLLRYAWCNDSGLRSVVEWSIESDGEGSRYTFLQQGLPYRELEGESGLPAGWHGWLDMFDAHLDGGSISKEEQEASWNGLMAPYTERLDAIHFPRPGRVGGTPTGASQS